jgi:hypothetical protein
VFCAAILLFVPESPRWLAHKDRLDDALTVIASTHSDGDKDNPTTQLQYKEITEAINTERRAGSKTTYAEVFRTPNSRRRLLLVVSIAVLAMSSGMLLIYFSYPISDIITKATTSFPITWAICLIMLVSQTPIRSWKL